MSFSNNLRRMRIEKGMTQKELGESLGLTQRFISKLETEYNEPNLQMLKTLADFFACSIDMLLDRENEFGSIVITKSEIESLYDTLDPVKKHMALTYVKQLSAIQSQEIDAKRSSLKKA